MKRSILISAIVSGAAILSVATVSARKKLDFSFSHRTHLEKVGVTCDACHAGATTAITAAVNLLPQPDVCITCHEEADFPGKNYTPDILPEREVIFDHQKHVDSLKLLCNVCHADVERAGKAPSAALPAMSVCVDCHRQKGISDDCSICHTRVETRRPADHVADWMLDHMEVARQEARTCETCHRQTYCQECHAGPALGLAVKGDASAPVDHIGPLATAQEGKDILILQRVHELNYRYIHPVDVKSKKSDCSVCHETRAFCVTCHKPENDLERYRPVWHDVSAFTFSGHAELARNDIEVCARCHDRDVAEPTCLRCHRSIVSPHTEGFMRDVHGPWHDDDNAVCFVCHDPGPRIAGQGFCGKCHGGEDD
ncbi:MAG: cytochrome c3 family protein [Candidatus Zixiibacteriota bacterium]